MRKPSNSQPQELPAEDRLPPDPAISQALAKTLANREYGQDNPAPEEPEGRDRITITLPSQMLQQLNDETYQNKRNKTDGHKAVSHIIEDALRAAGYGKPKR